MSPALENFLIVAGTFTALGLCVVAYVVLMNALRALWNALTNGIWFISQRRRS